MPTSRQAKLSRLVRDRRGAPLADLGTGNVFADLRFRRPDVERAKAELVSKIEQVMRRRSLTQAEAGAIMGLPQPKLSRLLNGGWGSCSVDRLARYLNKLGVSVRLSLRDEPRWSEGRTTVGP